MPDEPRPVRRVRRPVRARDGDGRARRARPPGTRRPAPTPPSPPRSSAWPATTSAGRRRCTWPSGSPRAPAPASMLKREDLNHTGAHKINNAVGQALLAVRLGKRRIVAETGAGQHGVAAATVCARFGLECHVYMGEEDIRRQHPNVVRMRMLGAEVVPVDRGLGDAQGRHERGHPRLDHERRDHPLPDRLGGRAPSLPDARARPAGGDRPRGARPDRWSARAGCPTRSCACVGGGSNAIGLFHPFLDDASVRLLGAEAGGDEHGHAATSQRSAGCRCCTARAATCWPTTTARCSRVALDLGRPRLPRRRARALVAEGRPAGQATSRSPTPRRWPRSTACAGSRASSPRSSRPTRWRWRCGAARPGELIVVGLSGRGDKDVDTVEALQP